MQKFSVLKLTNEQLKLFAYCMLVTIIIYIHFFANISLTLDDERAIARTNPLGWVGEGRWLNYLIELLVIPQPAIPLAPYLVFAFCLSLSYIYIIQTLEIKEKWQYYFLFPLFISFPAWWGILDYSANITSVAIGYLLTSLSFVFLKKVIVYNDTKKLSTYLVSSLLLACAIATYQIFIAIFVCFVTSYLLYLNSRTYQHTIKILFTSLKVLIIGGIIYACINFLFQYLLTPSNGYLNNNFNNIAAYFANPYVIFQPLSQLRIYTGSSVMYGSSMYAAILYLIFLVPYIIKNLSSKNYINILLLIALILTPLTFSFLAAKPLPLRTLFSTPYVVWFLGVLILANIKNKYLTIGFIGVCILYQIQTITVISRYSFTVLSLQSSDKLLASQIYQKALSMHTGNDNTLKIDIYGQKPFNPIYRPGLGNATHVSFFEQRGSVPDRINNFMKSLGYIYIEPTCKEKMETIPVFETMPIWPKEGSVVNHQGILLVKLSNTIGSNHIRAIKNCK